MPSSCEQWHRLETFRREETLWNQNEKIQFAKETLAPDKMHLSKGRLGWWVDGYLPDRLEAEPYRRAGGCVLGTTEKLSQGSIQRLTHEGLSEIVLVYYYNKKEQFVSLSSIHWSARICHSASWLSSDNFLTVSHLSPGRVKDLWIFFSRNTEYKYSKSTKICTLTM